MQTLSDKVQVGIISGVHGIKGLVKVKSYTENPESIFSYKALYDETMTRAFILTLKGVNKDFFLTEVDGISSRNEAEAIKGTKLYIPKSALPETDEDSFYHFDLLGLQVQDKNGKIYGEICGIYNFGAGDVLEAKTAQGKNIMFPFTKQAVPVINTKGGFVTIASDEWFAETNERKTSKKAEDQDVQS